MSRPIQNGNSTEVRQKSKAKGRKNISISFAVWSRLRTHGIYGDSIDDIFNRLMDKADELNRRNNILTPSTSTHVPAREQEHTHGKERKLIEQSKFFKIFERDIVTPKPGESSVSGKKSVEIDLDLPGLRFPIDKIDLIDYAIHLDKIFEYDTMVVGGFYYNHFIDLPDKTYTNKANLEEALVVMLNTPGHDFYGEKSKVVGINLLTTKEEIEKSYMESGKREADREFKSVDEYYNEIDKKLLDAEGQKKERERKRLHQERYQQELDEHSKEIEKHREEEQRYQREYEQQELEDKKRFEEEQREIEEAAVKDALDKQNK